ncbi:MAG: ChbG/HpnK family deacetylase [Anaerolineales bacterium]|nr:ChbG/HpnK family deacetylase [Anaerolineales bacterium]
MMTLQLIVNADDYGRSPNVSRGIRQAHRQGIVTSTTCMMNFANVADDLSHALQETPALGLGVHLVLTAERPLLPPAQLPTLTTREGTFPRLNGFLARLDTINPAEAKAEWHAQIEKFRQLTGRNPTHLDSHHHTSYFSAGLFRAMLELAQEYHCAIRQVTAQGDNLEMAGLPPQILQQTRTYAPRLLAEFNPPRTTAFYTSFYDDQATEEELLRILHALPQQGIYELMCHPGYVDADLLGSTTYARQRERELALLTAEAVKQAVTELNIELVEYTAVMVA